MAQNGCFQHDSCDGTSWSERIWGFYPQARMLGENIAAGYSTAKAVVDAWLCDAIGGQCAADGTSAAGHRTNIMNAGLRQAGMGYAPDTSGTVAVLWVQDLVSNEPLSKPPIVAGCHDFLLSGKTSFLLNYRDPTGRPPISVQVVIAGVAQNMNLDLGTAAAGTYRLDVGQGGDLPRVLLPGDDRRGRILALPWSRRLPHRRRIRLLHRLPLKRARRTGVAPTEWVHGVHEVHVVHAVHEDRQRDAAQSHEHPPRLFAFRQASCYHEGVEAKTGSDAEVTGVWWRSWSSKPVWGREGPRVGSTPIRLRHFWKFEISNVEISDLSYGDLRIGSCSGVCSWKSKEQSYLSC